MRNSLASRASLLLAIASLSLWASAQIRDLTVNVPFEFSAGDTTFQAGEVRFQIKSERLVISGAKGRKAVLMPEPIRMPGRAVKTTRLLFNRYSDRYFLAEVWLQGTPNGMHLSKSQAERELQDSGQTPVTITLTVK